ncbi:unnamed protein product [Closterium sp. NIES-54]
MEQITMQLDLTPSVWEEGEEAAAEGDDGEKVQEAPAGGGDDVETSGSTKEGAGSEEGEQQQGKSKEGNCSKVVLYLPKGLALEVFHQLLLHVLDLLHAAAEEKNVVHVDQKQQQRLPLLLEKEALIRAAGPESHLL